MFETSTLETLYGGQLTLNSVKKKKKKACGSLLITHGLPRWKQIALFWLLRSYDFETRYNSRDSFYFFYFFLNKLYSLLGTSRHIHSIGKGKIASE